MVYFKISDGEVTRKFKVNPGDITYQQLRERIASLFPKALEGENLLLKYRDADGDLITISTNEEFQEALSELPEDHVWKLHIHGGATARATPFAPLRRRANIPSDFFFHPTHMPFGGGMFSDPWFRRPTFPSWMSTGYPWSSLDRQFEKMLEEHASELSELHNTMETEAAAAKPSEEGAAVQTQSGGAVAETSEGMKIKNFGSWEPREFEGPFGKGRIIGPVGYYVSWSSGPEGKKTEKKAETEKEEAEEKEQKSEASAKESTEGMET